VYDQVPYGVLVSGGLDSQVPYGVLLSGGLDSLVITLCMIRCPMACCCLVDWTPW
jgi:asparagine synthetase B (glutamine-hydrolysing)